MINRLFIITVLAFIGFLAYGQGAQAVAPLQCPCDIETTDGNGGLTGNDILDMVCPGGNLAEDADFLFRQDEVEVFTEDPDKSYSVFTRINEFPLFFCSIGEESAFRVIRLRQGDYEFCRQSLIERCDLEFVRAIPTMSEWGLIATAGVLGLVGLYAVRRRRAQA